MTASATALAGLIGWPVAHSVSPAMHNAAFAHLGLDWRYVALPVAPEPAARVGEAVRGLRALGFRGANVTVPHKQAVMPHLDRLSPAAQAIGAVNTILVEPDGALAGDNTDAPGFVADLRAYGVEPAGRRVLVLGAGGSANAVTYGLLAAGAAEVAILNRTASRTDALVAQLRGHFPDRPVVNLGTEAGGAAVAGFDLVVNCTSLGMTPHVDASPLPAAVGWRPGQVLYDLVYNPPATRLMRDAAAGGARVIGGLGMLVRQGALAFERWTSQAAPVAVMVAAARARFFGALAQSLAPTPADRRAAENFTIRRATAEDAAALSALNAHVQDLHEAAVPQFFKPVSSTTFPVALVVELLGYRPNVFFLAELDGRPAGYLWAVVRRRSATESTYSQDAVHIEQMGVAPEFRGRGCGQQLMDAARELARSLEIHTVTLDVWRFNEEARRFYERQGFVGYYERMWQVLEDRTSGTEEQP
jgi:shikimate dehydrogenase